MRTNLVRDTHGVSLVLVLGVSLLVGCGESKVTSTPVNGASLSWTQGQYAPFDQYMNRCAAPRSGIDPATGRPYEDRAGSAAHEKFALRSYSHQAYLWAGQLSDQDPTTSLNPQEYFDLLKIPSDRFHFYESSQKNYQEFVLGKPLSYGISWFRDGNQEVVVTYVERNSPAALAGVVRGDRVVTIDGLTEQALGYDRFITAVYPTDDSPSHRFVFKNSRGEVQAEKRLTAEEIQVNSVQNISYFSAADGHTVAYFSFGSFNGTAERELTEAVNTINQHGAQDLILDLRFNGGGYLDVASELAFMVGGTSLKGVRVFSTLRYAPGNNLYGGDEEIAFFDTTQGAGGDMPKGQALPSLNLKRLYVLTSHSTCSASESLINGLRGADFPVIQVGAATCGKPYGMIPLSNCGFEYFTINFRYENAKGFSDFENGLAPRNSVQAQGSPLGCEVSDPYNEPLGSLQEPLLAAALKHIDSGSCGTNSLAAPRRASNPLQHPNPSFSNALGPRLTF